MLRRLNMRLENPYEQSTGHYTGYRWAEEATLAAARLHPSRSMKAGAEYEADEDEYQT